MTALLFASKAAFWISAARFLASRASDEVDDEGSDGWVFPWFAGK